MTHQYPAGGNTAAVPSTMVSHPTRLPTDLTTARRPDLKRHLDRNGLRAGVLARQRKLSNTENEMVAACEKAAERGAARAVRIDDRATWDHATWQRYLDAAARLEPEYGPKLRRLYQEIDQLSRLIALPLAA